MRAMLGADRPQDSGSVWLPPAGADSDGAPASGHDPGADSVSFLPSAWPLARRGYVTRGHAGDATGLHPGVDIAVAAGSYIRTAGAGVVEAAGRDSVYGKYVRIRHRDGYESLYAHASQLFVAPNDSVEWHEVIALSGNSGTSTAPHLHFEIWKDGRPVDPIQQVTGDR
jgi:murein DD-endopeptidase MepM/ murein hydrolase activator NlpD